MGSCQAKCHQKTSSRQAGTSSSDHAGVVVRSAVDDTEVVRQLEVALAAMHLHSGICVDLNK